MSQYIGSFEAARTLKLSRSAIRKMQDAGDLPYTLSDHNKRLYPRSFVEGLAAASNGIPVTRDFVRLFKLIWEYDNGVIPREEARQQINELRRLGQVLTRQEVAELLGYRSNTITLWKKRGWIRSVPFWRTQLSLYTDIAKLKALSDGFTVHETAAALGVSLNTVRKRAREGQFEAAMQPSGALRANPAQVCALAAEQAKLKAACLPAPEAARLLGVSVQRLFRWKIAGAIRAELIGERPQYVAADIMALVKRFQTVTPGFEWLSPIYTEPDRAKQLWPATKAIRFLEVVQSQFNQWTHQDLLPYYIRTPAGLASVRREYIASYLISLKTYAADQKITKALLQEYLAACQEMQPAA